MNRQEFESLISLYQGVHVKFDTEKDKLKRIRIDFYRGKHEETIYCEITADWLFNQTYIHHVRSMNPEELLRVSYVIKILCEYLKKGAYK